MTQKADKQFVNKVQHKTEQIRRDVQDLIAQAAHETSTERADFIHMELRAIYRQIETALGVVPPLLVRADHLKQLPGAGDDGN